MPANPSISMLLEHWDAQKGTSPCLTEIHTTHQLTYRQVACAVAALRIELGSEPQTILVCLPGGITTSLLWLAALSGGHMLIPASPELTRSEYAQLKQKHQPTLSLLPDQLQPYDTTALSSTLIQARIDQRLAADPNLQGPIEQEGSVYFSTSGSTGAPKGMKLTASQLLTTARAICTSHQLTETDRCLTPLPFHHVNAPVVGLLSTIVSGGQLLIAQKYSTSQFWNWVQAYDPTWISLVPAMIAMLLTQEQSASVPHPSLRFIRTASAPLPKANLLEFEATFAIPVIETYGISEAGSTITANPLPPQAHKPGSVGLPTGVELRICSATTITPLPAEEVGEVCIKGNNVITHYEDNRGQDSFQGDWFRTGDLGYLDKDGYLFLTGRSKDIIIRGGENIFPREIEEVIINLPGVLEVAVVGQPDAILGEKIVAFVTTNQSDGSQLDQQVLSYVQAQLSRQKVPDVIHVIDELPKTHTNKISKQALRAYVAVAQK